MSARTRMVWAAPLAVAAVVAGCTKGSSAPDACVSNAAVMQGLAPTCAGCHSQGAKPFFASLGAFEDQASSTTPPTWCRATPSRAIW